MQELPSQKTEYPLSPRLQIYRLRYSKSSSSNIKSAEKLSQILCADPELEVQERINILRDMHQNLTLKRRVLRKLEELPEPQKPMHDGNWFRTIKEQVYQNCRSFYMEVINLAHLLEMVYPPGYRSIQNYFGAGVASYFTFCWLLVYINIFNFMVTSLFLVIPQLVYESTLYSNVTVDRTGLFYDRFTKNVVEVAPGITYNIPKAYLVNVGLIYVFSLLVLYYRIFKTFGNQYIRSDNACVFSNVVFCSWNYGVGFHDLTRYFQANFCQVIKDLIHISEEKAPSRKIWEAAVFTFVTLFHIAVMCGLCYFMYFTISTFEKNRKVLRGFLLTLIMILVAAGFYGFLRCSERFETYCSRTTKLYISVIKLLILRSAFLEIYFYHFTKSNLEECYERKLGEDLLLLMAMNFFVQIVLFTFTLEYLRRKIFEHFFVSWTLSHLDIAYHTADLIYFQSLNWIGTYFMPLCSMLNILIFYTLTYLKANSVMENCKPDKSLCWTHKTQRFFCIAALAMWLFSIAGVGYIVIFMNPSKCGPFKSWEHRLDLIKDIFFVSDLRSHPINFLQYMQSPIFNCILVCFFCVVLIKLRAYAVDCVSLSKSLQNMLKQQRVDKTFLLHLLADIAKGPFDKNKDDRSNCEGGAAVIL
ncbi:transmembrane channel-like protein 5 isoform X2 [Stegodyphus dumicola]|nr:transmembrane channel-like protein 5 isoform X2 [Stegodyphus dumicola]XP_035208484.1 transmembrane channel-like protein 5 isoform X2 [Stegodyphus dumicola]